LGGACTKVTFCDQARHVWQSQYDLLSTMDELESSSLRTRFRIEGEEVWIVVSTFVYNNCVEKVPEAEKKFRIFEHEAEALEIDAIEQEKVRNPSSFRSSIVSTSHLLQLNSMCHYS